MRFPMPRSALVPERSRLARRRRLGIEQAAALKIQTLLRPGKATLREEMLRGFGPTAEAGADGTGDRA
jgi:hypothetical protein